MVGMKISDLKLLELSQSEQKMKSQVPLVLESQSLLEKLKQNQLGGIDPFETIGRVAVYRVVILIIPMYGFPTHILRHEIISRLRGRGEMLSPLIISSRDWRLMKLP